MKLLLASVALFIGLTVTIYAETYRVNVSRIDKDLYRDDQSKTIVETKYCHEYARRDDITLGWQIRQQLDYLSSTQSAMSSRFGKVRIVLTSCV